MKRHEEVVRSIELAAQPLASLDAVHPLVNQLKERRIVMLGEATHGTFEFYRFRAALSEALIRDHGFDFIAVEGDWPDGERLRRYVQRKEGAGSSAEAVLSRIHRWPRWMWANREVAALADRLRPLACGFYGLDVYSLFESIDEVLRYLRRVAPLMARRVERLYACFEPYRSDEIAYARSLLRDPEGCLHEAIQGLEEMLTLRTVRSSRDSDELFEAQQNARVVKNAEAYYRAMLQGDAQSWNNRDEHMLETLEQLLGHAGPGSKAIVWAHNTHIGDYRATDMRDNGYVNLGGLARLRWGAESVALVGFGSHHGHVTAGAAWGAAAEAMVLPPAREGSLEDHFHRAAQRLGQPDFFLSVDGALRDSALATTLGHRAVGVVYDPDHEGRSQYVPTSLVGRYDAFVYMDETTALHPLGGFQELGNVPETWPSGF